jgi:hypothetical protein
VSEIVGLLHRQLWNVEAEAVLASLPVFLSKARIPQVFGEDSAVRPPRGKPRTNFQLLVTIIRHAAEWRQHEARRWGREPLLPPGRAVP